jgi:hypothetical protein
MAAPAAADSAASGTGPRSAAMTTTVRPKCHTNAAERVIMEVRMPDPACGAGDLLARQAG